MNQIAFPTSKTTSLNKSKDIFLKVKGQNNYLRVLGHRESKLAGCFRYHISEVAGLGVKVELSDSGKSGPEMVE